MSLSFGGSDETFDYNAHACDCPICAFMVKHDLGDGSQIPQQLMAEFGQAQSEAVRVGAAVYG